MRNENRVGARPGGGAEQLAKGVAAAVVLVRRHQETALGDICGLLDILQPGNDPGLVRSVVLAGIDLADGNSGLTDRLPESLCRGLAFLVEISLGSDVVEIQRIGISLIRESGAVPDHHDKPASAQCPCNLRIVRRRATWPREAEHGIQTKECSKSANQRSKSSSRQNGHLRLLN